MSDEQIGRLLREQGRDEWRDPPDLWPAIRVRVATSTVTGEYARGWIGEFGKLVAGATVVLVFVAGLAAIFSSQRGTLPGAGEADDSALPHGALVTEGDALLTRWNDGQEEYELVAVDARTGEVSDDFPVVPLGPTDANVPQQVAIGGSKVAVLFADETATGVSAGNEMTVPAVNRLTIVDTETGELVEYALPGDGWANLVIGPQFSPDQQRLALISDRPAGSTVMLFDTTTAERIAEQAFDQRLRFLRFRPDGDSVVVFGQEPSDDAGVTPTEPPQVFMLDATTLETRWSAVLGEVRAGAQCVENCDAPIEERVTAIWHPGVTMDSQGEYLYVAHVDQPVIQQIDLQEPGVVTFGYAISPDKPAEIDYRGEAGGFADAHVSPEGDRMYLLFGGFDAYTVGLVELDLRERDATVRSSGNAPETGVPADWIEITPDGSGVFLGTSESIIRYDTAQGGFEERFSDWDIRPGTTLGGKPILLASNLSSDEPELGVVAPESLEIVERWTAEPGTRWAHPSGWSNDSIAR